MRSRLSLTHVLIGVVGFTAGELTDQLEIAMGVTLIATFALQAIAQRRLRGRTAMLEQRYRRLVEELPGRPLHLLAREDELRALRQPIDGRPPRLRAGRVGAQPTPLRRDPPPARPRRGAQEFAAAKKSGTPYEAEYRLLRNDGSIVWVRDRAVLVRDAGGGRTTCRASSST